MFRVHVPLMRVRVGLEHADLEKSEWGIPTAALESQSDKLLGKGRASSLSEC